MTSTKPQSTHIQLKDGHVIPIDNIISAIVQPKDEIFVTIEIIYSGLTPELSIPYPKGSYSIQNDLRTIFLHSNKLKSNEENKQSKKGHSNVNIEIMSNKEEDEKEPPSG